MNGTSSASVARIDLLLPALHVRGGHLHRGFSIMSVPKHDPHILRLDRVGVGVGIDYATGRSKSSRGERAHLVGDLELVGSSTYVPSDPRTTLLSAAARYWPIADLREGPVDGLAADAARRYQHLVHDVVPVTLPEPPSPAHSEEDVPSDADMSPTRLVGERPGFAGTICARRTLRRSPICTFGHNDFHPLPFSFVGLAATTRARAGQAAGLRWRDMDIESVLTRHIPADTDPGGAGTTTTSQATMMRGRGPQPAPVR